MGEDRIPKEVHFVYKDGLVSEQIEDIRQKGHKAEIMLIEEKMKSYIKGELSSLPYVFSIYEKYDAIEDTFYIYTFTDIIDYDKKSPIHKILTQLFLDYPETYFKYYIIPLVNHDVSDYITDEFNEIYKSN